MENRNTCDSLNRITTQEHPAPKLGAFLGALSPKLCQVPSVAILPESVTQPHLHRSRTIEITTYFRYSSLRQTGELLYIKVYQYLGGSVYGDFVRSETDQAWSLLLINQ